MAARRGEIARAADAAHDHGKLCLVGFLLREEPLEPSPTCYSAGGKSVAMSLEEKPTRFPQGGCYLDFYGKILPFIRKKFSIKAATFAHEFN